MLAVNESGAVEAKALPAGVGGLFERVKAQLIESERLLATSLDPELFMPESYLEIWASGERVKKVGELVKAFGQFPRLPRLLRPRVLHESIARGVREGKLVLQLPRGDGSVRTVWRAEPTAEDLARPEAEIVPVAFARLYELDAEILMPSRLEALWESDAAPLGMKRLEFFFDGLNAPQLASPEVLDKAVRGAVKRGLLMARLAGKTYLRQELPELPLPHDTELLLPPEPVRAADIGPKGMPEAWNEGGAALSGLAALLAKRRGYEVPWILLRDAVTEGLSNRLFEVVEQGAWPCGPEELDRIHLKIVEIIELNPDDLVSSATQPAWSGNNPTLGKVKTALEAAKGRTYPEEVFRKAVEEALKRGIFALGDAKKGLPSGKAFFDTKVRLPKATLFAEAGLSAQELSDLGGLVAELKRTAPELDFSFRLSLTAEGEKPSTETLNKLNELLQQASSKLKLE
jgi:hypothetical protein